MDQITNDLHHQLILLIFSNVKEIYFLLLKLKYKNISHCIHKQELTIKNN